jgi:cytidylate kinase
MPAIDRIVDRQVRTWELERAARRAVPGEAGASAPGRIATVSRQRGARGSLLAAQLAERLGFNLLDRDVIDRICASSGQARRIVELLDGHARSQLELWVESLLQGHAMDTNEYVRALLRVIFSASELGGVVVVGRGASFILGHGRGFHVRVVAPRDERIRAVAEEGRLDPQEAAREVDRADRERSDWVRRALGRSIDDALGYDLVLNSHGVAPERAAELLAVAARAKFERLRAARASAGTLPRD